jgi:hypothetical protein
MEQDEKTLWKRLREDSYKQVTRGLSDEEKKAYDRGVYESPKTYVNGFAINDGTWVRYIHTGKLWCKNKEEVLRYMYGYVCFLLKVGDYDGLELFHFCLCYLIEMLEYKKGLFGCSMENRKRIVSIIEKVCRATPAEVKTAKIDKRRFCFDPKIKKGMTVAEKTRAQKKQDKELTDAIIAELRDPAEEKSVRDGARIITERGFPVSPSRYHQWLKENPRL